MALNYAGFGARLGASLLDGLLMFAFLVPAAVLFIVSAAVGGTGGGLCRDTATRELHTCRGPNGPLLAIGFLALFGALIGYYVWIVLRLGRTGQTPGHKAQHIKVVDKNTGQPIGGGRAFGRYLFAGFISGQICYLGYLWMLWHKEKRTWHDMVLNSIVVKV